MELKKDSKAKDAELKKTSFESGHDGGIVRLAFTPVKGHSFWAEVIALAVCMYIRMGCGFRKIVNGFELFNEFLSGAKENTEPQM